ncbi:KRTAP23-1 isoform 1 [Pongo abelii]|uniref:Keratin-associated protein n=1 Tax=Pongo abelii TaxID=9601 RepID=H2P2W3_PONAB|nr:KRTAP23-1 isoform 1 [Pongo abelii]
MSYNCCCGNFSCSCRGYLCYSGYSCVSSYPSNLAYSTEPLISQHLPAGFLSLQGLSGDLLGNP